MSANTIQAKYDELESIAKRFGQWAERNAEMSSRLRQHVEQLKYGDWIGKGSEAFFKEMGDEVLPAVGRLTYALQQSQSTVNEIILIIQRAEEEAASPFTGEASGLSEGSAMGNIVKEVIDDVVRQVAGGTAGPSAGSFISGGVKEMVEEVTRQVVRESQGSFMAGGVKEMVEEVAHPFAGGAPVLFQAHAPGNGTPPASPQKSQTPTQRDKLQSAYNVTIEKGDKEWSDEELKHLEKALSSLSKEEKNALRGYRFIRWSSSEERLKLDPTYKHAQDEGGLHEMDLNTKSFKISIYDKGLADPEATSDMVYGVDKGQFTILHEMGHAMGTAEIRNRYEAKQPWADVDGRAAAELEKLMKGRAKPTEYAKTNQHELFAEMFAVYKANPKYLQNTHPQVFNWFQNGKFLKQ